MTIAHTYLDGHPGGPTIVRRIISTQTDQAFIASLLDLLGDVRALYVFSNSGTTLTDKSKNQRLLLWSEEVGEFDISPSRLGSGVQVPFNGVDESGGGDPSGLSFGDGKVDQAFTVFGLVSVVDPTLATIFRKWSTAPLNREWLLYLDGNQLPTLRQVDESTNGVIGRRDTSRANDFPRQAWVFILATSDGSGASAGMRVYLDAVRVDDSDVDSGTYVAMEGDGELPFEIGADFKGSMALAGVIGKAMPEGEVWGMKELINGYFGLSL